MSESLVKAHGEQPGSASLPAGRPDPAAAAGSVGSARRGLAAAALTALMALSACAGGSAGQGPSGARPEDPLQTVNRAVFSFNRGFDRALFRPVSVGYGVVFPNYVRDKVNNVQYHFSLPGEMVNNALQGRGTNFFHNTFRFLVNTTVGVLGIFDPATSMGLERRETDFGETLFVWGAGEGAFLQVPFFGPYTTRHLTGDVVDLFLNPLSIVGLDAPEVFIPAGTYVLEAADNRYEFRDSVDSVLYESADGYAQTRLIYLDNRRFTLERNASRARGEEAGGGVVIDPFEDSAVIDPYGGAPAAGPAASAPLPAEPAAPAQSSVSIDPYEELYGD